MFGLATTAAIIALSTLLIGLVYRLQYHASKRSQGALVAVHFSSVTAIIISYCLLCLAHYSSPGPWAWAGWLTFAAGSGVFWYCTFIHRSCLVPDDGKGLTCRGPYRFVRHPMYAGGLLAALGLAAVAPAWEVLAAWLFLLATLCGLAMFEERELVERLGAAYQGYMCRTKRLIPGVL